tara:strand:- start:83 stop:778 length:696 start_codon:yes stop_codon:yes gene_type:complete
MVMPFDMSCFDQGEYPKYSIEMSFRGYEDNSDLKTWLEHLQELDEKLVHDGVKNSLPWLKKKTISEEVVRALYNPIVRVSKDKETGEPDGKYPPTHRIRVPFRNGKFLCDVYDATSREQINLDEVPLGDLLRSGTRLAALIRPTGIWFANKKYGLSWQVVQLKLRQRSRPMGYAFLDDPSDPPLLNDSDDGLQASPTTGVTVEDTEEEEEEEVVVASPPKKRGRKKKKTTK